MILDRIVETKRREVSELRERLTMDEAYRQASLISPALGFLAAIDACEHPVALIAEVKKASPSKGLIREDFDPETIGREYGEAGATCLSVLTDRDYFSGDPAYLLAAKEAAGRPTLRKDFIIDELQVAEARLLGADAVLLIVAILDDQTLRSLRLRAEELGMSVLVEVHDEREMDRALNSGARLIGINNRDLRDFSVDLATTERLAQAVPKDRVLVSESGIATVADISRVRNAGARAVLVGETLMRAPTIEQGVRTLFGAMQ